MATADVVNNSELWYCHSCQKEVLPNLCEFSCSQCEGGFIEPSQRPPLLHPLSPLSAPRRTARMSFHNNSSSLQGIHHGEAGTSSSSQALEGPRGVRRPHPSDIVVSAEADLTFEGGEVGATGGGGAMRASRVFRRPLRRTTHISVHRIHAPGLLSGLAGAAEGQGSGGNFQAFLNQFITSLAGGGAGGAHHIQVQPLLLTAHSGDYAWTRGGLDNIITMLMNQLDGSGPPPAEKDVIDALPEVNISQQEVDAHSQCSVCMEDYVVEEMVRRLPCKHCFHTDCIVPWLELHGTCPVCRSLLDSPTAAEDSSQQDDHDTTLAPHDTSSPPQAINSLPHPRIARISDSEENIENHSMDIIPGYSGEDYDSL